MDERSRFCFWEGKTTSELENFNLANMVLQLLQRHSDIWMMPQHQTKDHNTVKLMAIMAERDSAIQERNLALSAKKVALAERDMAMLQRDAAITERNNAIMERDHAIASLEFARRNLNCNGERGCEDVRSSPPKLSDAPYDHTRGMHISEALPISTAPKNAKSPRSKQMRKEAKDQAIPSMKASKSRKKSKKESEDLNQQATIAAAVRGGEDRNKPTFVRKQKQWKDQDLGLNKVTFDESTMPPPVCSCTGTFHQCYKWGNGGWQSSCCTTMLSQHPLPAVPGKPHARVGGRKMSGTVFTRLISRRAAEGHDLSMPQDLKDHWARHGTNAFVTIK